MWKAAGNISAVQTRTYIRTCQRPHFPSLPSASSASIIPPVVFAMLRVGRVCPDAYCSWLSVWMVKEKGVQARAYMYIYMASESRLQEKWVMFDKLDVRPRYICATWAAWAVSVQEKVSATFAVDFPMLISCLRERCLLPVRGCWSAVPL